MNENKLIAYGRCITNSGIHTGNGTTSHVKDSDKANKSNLIETYIDRKDKIENEKQRISITLSAQQTSHLTVAALKIEYQTY